MKKYIYPAIEQQLLSRVYFCSPEAKNPLDISQRSASRVKVGEVGMTMADICIYHDIQTALMTTNSNGLDPALFPCIATWLAKMSSHTAIIEQDRKLNDFINGHRWTSILTLSHEFVYAVRLRKQAHCKWGFARNETKWLTMLKRTKIAPPQSRG